MARVSPLVPRLTVAAAVVLVVGLIVALTEDDSLSSSTSWVVAVAINGSLIVLGVCGALWFVQTRDPVHE